MCKIKLLDTVTVMQGGVSEETAWGFYQFPKLYNMADGKIALRVHTRDDSPEEYGTDGSWYISSDSGLSWEESKDKDIQKKCGTILPNGDIIRSLEKAGKRYNRYGNTAASDWKLLLTVRRCFKYQKKHG